jgi:hypothetical protein
MNVPQRKKKCYVVLPSVQLYLFILCFLQNLLYEIVMTAYLRHNGTLDA